MPGAGEPTPDGISDERYEANESDPTLLKQNMKKQILHMPRQVTIRGKKPMIHSLGKIAVAHQIIARCITQRHIVHIHQGAAATVVER